jgi:nicotinate-nucleotide pyrophosphorylase (carboxylating)
MNFSSPHPPIAAVRAAVQAALAEDLLPMGDITSWLVPGDQPAAGQLVARQGGVFAGRLCVDVAAHEVDPALVIAWSIDDGDAVDAGQVLADIHGPLRSLLGAERTMLNFASHLSGIATLTNAFVTAVHGRAKIRDTRKTTPGLRALEKAAVRAGGGMNHRGSLSEAILVKDNHLNASTITEVVARSREMFIDRNIEIECDSLDQVREAVAAGADMVLLDNMSPADAAAAVELVAGRIPTEVSGRVDLSTAADYAAVGVDCISVGAITHSAPILDIGLDFH